MRPEIQEYLARHGREYTPEALRRGLVDAGHDPAEVDEALDEWRASSAEVAPDVPIQTFSRWAFWLHAGAVAGMFVLVLAANGLDAFGLATLGALVLILFLLLGWMVSWWIGRALLPRTGLAVALIFPAASALLLGGTCVALLGGFPGVAQ